MHGASRPAAVAAGPTLVAPCHNAGATAVAAAAFTGRLAAALAPAHAVAPALVAAEARRQSWPGAEADAVPVVLDCGPSFFSIGGGVPVAAYAAAAPSGPAAHFPTPSGRLLAAHGSSAAVSRLDCGGDVGVLGYLPQQSWPSSVPSHRPHRQPQAFAEQLEGGDIWIDPRPVGSRGAATVGLAGGGAAHPGDHHGVHCGRGLLHGFLQQPSARGLEPQGVAVGSGGVASAGGSHHSSVLLAPHFPAAVHGGGGGGSATAQAAPSATPAPPSEERLAEMQSVEELGFSRQQVAEAFRRCSTAAASVDWILSPEREWNLP